jgi:hypothetical protein
LSQRHDKLKLIGHQTLLAFVTVKSLRWIEVNIAVFSGSINKFFARLPEIRLLDTPDHFVYDSACTMILNLGQSFAVAEVGSVWVLI